MAKITKITRQIKPVVTKKRVAAYARVSEETERLHNSLSAQVSYYSDLIQKNPEWEYAGVYADEGITGTLARKRSEFQRMMADAEAGKIDIILTKSISRYARNTLELLESVRHLKELGIEVRFEKEHISSLSGDGEVMLTLLASFAQSESESISKNVKWGIHKRMQAGIPYANGHMQVYGYRWEGDDLVIVPEEAAVVRRIFQNFLDGKSRLETEKEFAAEGITTRQGCRWVDSNIKQVLCNCTYTGDLLLQKEYISDPITKKRRKNHGELPQYLVEGHHQPIIDRETFDFVQAEMARRKELGALANKSLNVTCFTGKLKCPYCGKSLVHNRVARKNRGAEDFWKCGTSKKKDKRCPVKGGIRDDKLREACAGALGLDEFDEQVFLERVDFISVPESYKAEIHMKDGTVVTEDCSPTGHQDCWTEDYRAKTSEYRRSHRAFGMKGSCCFTTIIKCGGCGGNYQVETGSGKRCWRCRTNRDGISLREDALQAMTAQVLGLDAFDDAAVTERIEHIFVDGDTLTFRLKDGREARRIWVKPSKPVYRHSEEVKARMSQRMKAKWAEKKKAAMGESVKKCERSMETDGKKRNENPGDCEQVHGAADCKQGKTEGGGVRPRFDRP